MNGWNYILSIQRLKVSYRGEKEDYRIMKNYIVLDIENPNSRGNTVCSIALLKVVNGEVVDKIYTLINPEDRFDARNSEITNINSSMVLDKPTLKELWPKISKLIGDNIIVGHNVVYDLSVLSKSLDRYGIEVPVFRYSCTLQLSKRYLNSYSYKLEELAKQIGVEYTAHIAEEDAYATYRLFEYINNKNDIDDSSIKDYSFEFSTSDKLDEKLSTNINNLFGIIQGINYDGTVDEKEVKFLKNWVEENQKYKQYMLFNRIINKLSEVLEDDVVSDYERVELLCLVNSIHSSKLYNETTLGLQILQGILQGITCDQKIVKEEVESLKTWLKENDYLSDVYPYDKVLLVVNEVLEDEILTETEKAELMDTFNDILNPVKEEKADLDLQGRTFCLSGEFKKGSKNEIKEVLKNLGGIEKSGVSSKLDYLFVGGIGSEAWKFGNVGGKIVKALELQEKGSSIKIISEDDMFVGLID